MWFQSLGSYLSNQSRDQWMHQGRVDAPGMHDHICDVYNTQTDNTYLNIYLVCGNTMCVSTCQV